MVILELHSGMQVTNKSSLSGKSNTMVLDFTMPQYMAWKGGALSQDAFPQLDADGREFLMTGITPAEWNEAFAQSDVGPNFNQGLI